MKKIILFLCLFVLASVKVSYKDLTRKTFSMKGKIKSITKAFSFDSLQAQDQTAQAAYLGRFFYYIVNGPPDGNWPSMSESAVGSGPEFSESDGTTLYGLVGIITGLLGPNALGGGLEENGYSSCSDLPLSGSASITEEDGSVYTMAFSAGSLSIPSGWEGAGATFDKRVSVDVNGSAFMVAEFSCDTSTNTGYLRMSVANDSGGESSENREMETYYQFNSSTGLARVNFYMIYDDDSTADGADLNDEHFVMKFSSEDGDTFYMTFARAAIEQTDSIKPSAFIVQMSGSQATQLTSIRYIAEDGTSGQSISDLSDTTLPAAGPYAGEFCIDFSTDAASSGCPAYTDLGALDIGSQLDLNIANVSAMSLTAIE